LLSGFAAQMVRSSSMNRANTGNCDPAIGISPKSEAVSSASDAL
jgi:hypothetical protein